MDTALPSPLTSPGPALADALYAWLRAAQGERPPWKAREVKQ